MEDLFLSSGDYIYSGGWIHREGLRQVMKEVVGGGGGRGGGMKVGLLLHSSDWMAEVELQCISNRISGFCLS